MSVYAGIDFGTSGARLAVIDRTGQPLFQIGDRFQQPTDWTKTWKATLFHQIQQVPTDLRQEIGAIAINGTSSTVLLCDGAGQPIAPPLLYNDARGAGELDPLRQFFAQQQENSPPGKDTVLSATSSLVKLLWWQQQPYFAQAHYLLHQADWLAYLLHGQLGISDYHNSLKLGYDVAHLCYPNWMERLGILPLLPRVVAPGTPIGLAQPQVASQLGLSEHCQICAGTTDSIAAFLASGAASPGEAVTSLGSTLVLKLLSKTPVENGQYGIYSHRLGDLWLVGGASNTGGAVLQQFFSAAELEGLSAQISASQESSLDYYPLVQPGERFPINDAQLRPRLEPRPADPVAFLHGLLESMARIEAEGYRLLQTLGASPLTQVYTAGGGAKNETWNAIRSRQMGVSVIRSPHTEAAYGTALLALRGCHNLPEN
ncbi:FGGY-family carbohydrate kinase [Kovacikia minuta CCNUW1]|uniref:FGGY-family carbohydrate kinase n=1 Tax=Kovacikia minuta TaxID=2931930 RepID=UPI001CCCECD8|nr:FGGY-family carbohydrate kinase [Kovacikia minuta]UBF29221.1 FGGY-family carbohydrate kinase [Kovacikia minuta CCNUW1]